MYLNVNDFSGLDSDSRMIQAAIDEAAQTGKSVIVPKYNKRTGKDVWDISQAIILRSGTTLILQNSHLRLADGAICNMFAGENLRYVTVKGEGEAVLDGGKHNGLYEVNGIARTFSNFPDHACYENCTVFLRNVEHLTIENLTVRDQRYWAFCLTSVTHSRVACIHFESSSNVPNQDGVDLQRGCHDVIIENITGCVGDNVVALLATEDDLYPAPVSDRDIHDITIRNLHIYSVGGCALVRLLNHDGCRIYNVFIDNVIETSPWSMEDAPVAANPDLNLVSEGGVIHPLRHLTPGEEGYRCEAAILIGESYWYHTSKACHGDTYGIHVSNVMTHARYALFLNNTLLDSSFDHIRLFGNGFAAAYFGEGTMENITLEHITYDRDCRPLPADEHIYIDWNNTRSDGFACFLFHGTHAENITFRNIRCGRGMQSVFGGSGSGSVKLENCDAQNIPVCSAMEGIELTGGF